MDKQVILELLNSKLAWYFYVTLGAWVWGYLATHIADWGLKLREKLNSYRIFKATQIDDMGIKILERVVISMWENGNVQDLKEKGLKKQELADALSPKILESFYKIASEEQKNLLKGEHSKLDGWVLENAPAVVRWVKNRNKLAKIGEQPKKP